MFSIKNSLISLAVCLGVAVNSYPIGQTTVNVISGVGGLATGGIVGAITYNSIEDKWGAGMSDRTQKLLTGLAGTGSGALAAYILYKWLCNYTPEGRYLNSLKFYERIRNDRLFSYEMGEEDLIAHVNARWIGNWPLVLAREYIFNIRYDLKESLDRLEKAMDELQKGEDSYGLHNKCFTLKKLLSDFLPIIENRVGMITKHPSYNFQVEIFQKHLEKEKDRQEAAWQHSADRWDRQREREQRERERERKERLAARLAAQGQPVQVNLNL